MTVMKRKLISAAAVAMVSFAMTSCTEEKPAAEASADTGDVNGADF